MKTRLTLVFLTMLLVVCAFNTNLPQYTAQADKQSINQPVRQWLRERIDAQLSNNSSEQLPQAQALRQANRVKESPIPAQLMAQLSTPLRNLLSTRYSDAMLNRSDVEQNLLAADSNQRINDPQQEVGSRVQNGTASAISGNNIIVAYNDIGIDNAAISYSNDGGLTWQQTHIPQFANAVNLGSGVVAARGDSFYYAGVALTSNNVSLAIFSRSTDRGASWSNPIAVLPSASPSAIQDKPWVAVDNTDGATSGNVYVGFTELRGGSRAGSRIVCGTSTDGGVTFSTVIPVTPLNGFNVQGATIAVGAGGDVNFAWGDLTVSGIGFARSTDGGLNFTTPVSAASVPTFELIGPLLNSHFATNGLPSIAVDNSTSTTNGTLYITFSSPSPTARADKADVFMVTSNNKGVSWSEPIKLNDDNSNNDQFLPSVATAIDGTVAAMWYDRRNDPIHNGMLDVYAVASRDGGKSFTANRRISTGNWLVLTTPPNIRANYHGDYNQMSAFTDRASFFFNWGDDRSGLDADVFSAKVMTDDLINARPSFTIAPVTPSQTLLAGQSALYRLRIGRDNGFNGPIDFQASSDDSGITFSFDNRGLNNGELIMRVRTTASVAAGSHPLILSATSQNQTITTTLRLNLLTSDQFSRLPLKIAQSPARSIQPQGVYDRQGGLNVIWTDDFTGNFRIYYSRSVDGSSFSSPVDISLSNFTNFNPSIVVDQNSVVHTTWQECIGSDCSVKYARSKNLGVSFEAPQIVSTGVQFGEQPSIEVTPKNEVMILFDGIRTFNVIRFEIFAARSPNGGDRFSVPTTLTGDPSRSMFAPAIATDQNGNSVVAFESCVGGNCRIETKLSSNAFDTFKDGGIASSGINFAVKPTVSMNSSGNIFIAMTGALIDGDNRFEIFTTASTDAGLSYSPLKNVSNNLEASNDAAILADGDQVYIAWLDRTPGNPDILFVRSQDRGVNFSAPINLTINNTISQVPTLAKDPNGGIQLCFEDEMDGNDEIYTFRLDGPASATAISAIDPSNGPIGTNVSIRGRNLSLTTSVQIGGRPAEFFLNSPSELIAVVPAGATTGLVVVTSANGTINSPTPFTLTSAISAGPPNLDFGMIGVGQVIDARDVVVRNLSNSALKINSINLSSNEFRLLNAPKLPTQLAANDQLVLKVKYQPNTVGNAQAQLQINSADSVLPSLSIALIGSASAPVLSLITPAGGEKLKAGESFNIEWKVENIEPISFDLVFSNDGGQTFTTSIASGLSATTRSFNWNVVTLKTKAARVAVVMRTANGVVFMDQSKANFKIKVKK